MSFQDSKVPGTVYELFEMHCVSFHITLVFASITLTSKVSCRGKVSESF